MSLTTCNASNVRSYTRIPKADLTPPGDYDLENSPLRQHSWREGELRFTFLVNPPRTTQDWEEFQVRRTVVACV